jgi:hypothetical protein
MCGREQTPLLFIQLKRVEQEMQRVAARKPIDAALGELIAFVLRPARSAS